MGMSLSQKAYYGWRVGCESDLDFSEKVISEDGYFDEYEYNEGLKEVQIHTSYYYEYSTYYVCLIEGPGSWDGEPVKMSDVKKLKPSEINKKRLVKELNKIKKDFNLDYDIDAEKPEWLVTASYG